MYRLYYKLNGIWEFHMEGSDYRVILRERDALGKRGYDTQTRRVLSDGSEEALVTLKHYVT